MDFDSNLISHTLEHRGCGIRAASYEVRPQSWLPEACVWLQTDRGHRKIWVHSFAHCFAAEDLTFSNQFDANSWALFAAKSVIDRAIEELNVPSVCYRPQRLRCFSTALRIARHSVASLARFHRPRSR